jgi:hypothetical protein
MLSRHPQIVKSTKVNTEIAPKYQFPRSKFSKEIHFFDSDDVYHQYGLELYERVISAQEKSPKHHVCQSIDFPFALHFSRS